MKFLVGGLSILIGLVHLFFGLTELADALRLLFYYPDPNSTSEFFYLEAEYAFRASLQSPLRIIGALAQSAAGMLVLLGALWLLVREGRALLSIALLAGIGAQALVFLIDTVLRVWNLHLDGEAFHIWLYTTWLPVPELLHEFYWAGTALGTVFDLVWLAVLALLSIAVAGLAFKIAGEPSED